MREKGVRRTAVVAWLRLVRLVDRVDRASEGRLRAWDLNLAQFDVLAHVGAAEGITQQELADKLFVTKGNVCQLLDRMQTHGLIRRCPEGRANRLYLTEAGRDLYQHAVPVQEDQVARVLAPLSPEEQKEFLRLIHKIERGLRDGCQAD